MNVKNPLIKKFKTDNNYYIYDTWTNEILKVQKDFWNYFDNGDKFAQKKVKRNHLLNKEKIIKEVKKAKHQGYLSSGRPKIVKLYNCINDVLKKLNNNKFNNLILEVTEKCNLRCSYCPYHENFKSYRNHTNRNMTWSIAKDSIKYGIQHSNQDMAFAISFTGGEPLLNFRLIKKTVIFLKENYPKRDFIFSLTTNGCMINQEIANFLIENEFSILLSIDGPKSLHDRYRKTINGKPTYELAMDGYELLKKLNSENKAVISLNCLLSPPYDLHAIKNFCDLYEEFVDVEKSSNFKMNFYDQFNMNKESKIYKLQSDEIFIDYRKSSNYGKINQCRIGKSMFESKLLSIQNRSMKHMNKEITMIDCCLPGERKFLVTCNGNLLPCDKVLPNYSFGNISTGIDIFKLFSLQENWYFLFKDLCKDCWAVRLCKKCFVDLDPTHKFLNNYNNHKKFCNNKKQNIKDSLIKYCNIMESNPDFFSLL